MGESRVNRLVNAIDDRKMINRFYFTAGEQQKCRKLTFNYRGESRSRPYFPSSSFGT